MQTGSIPKPSRVRRRSVLQATLAASVTLALAPAIGDAALWRAGRDLSLTGQNRSPQVAMNAAGDAVAVWIREGRTDRVQAAYRRGGGSFSAPVTVYAGSKDRAYCPDSLVAIDAAGHAVAVWACAGKSGWLVRAATRAPGGSWSAAVTLSARNAFSPHVAINESGDVIVVWEHSDGVNGIVQAAMRPSGGSWSAPIDLSADGASSYDPRAAIDRAGGAIVVWSRGDDVKRSGRVVQAATHAPGGVWSTPVDLSTHGRDAGSASVASNEAGDAVVAWSAGDDAQRIVQAALGRASAAFSAPTDVSAPGQKADHPSVAIDQAGNAIAVWQQTSDAYQDTIEQAARPQGGSFSTPVALAGPLGPLGILGAPRLRMNRAGDAVAVWEGRIANLEESPGWVAATVRPVDGSFSKPVSLGTPGAHAADVRAAIDGFGNTIAVWRRYEHGTGHIQALGYDSAGRAFAIAGLLGRGLRVSPSRFSAARSGPAVRLSGKRGARLTYTLMAPAQVRFVVRRAAPGRRLAGACVKRERTGPRSAPCTRFVRVPGSFTRRRGAGIDRFTFTGRVGGRRLEPGRYLVAATATATDGTVAVRRAGFSVTG